MNRAREKSNKKKHVTSGRVNQINHSSDYTQNGG